MLWIVPPRLIPHKFSTLRLRQNGWHFADYTLKCIILDENIWIAINILLKFVPKRPINSILALVLIMARCQPGDKPLSEPMMVSLLMHIRVILSQWVNNYKPLSYSLIWAVCCVVVHWILVLITTPTILWLPAKKDDPSTDCFLVEDASHNSSEWLIISHTAKNRHQLLTRRKLVG